MGLFWLLVRVRLQSARNTARETFRRHPLLATGFATGGAVLFTVMSAGFWLFFTFARRFGLLPETIYQVFYFLFLFLLAGAVPFVASTLLHSADYGLLFASPASPRAVVAAKLLDATVTNSLQFSVLGLPAILAAVWVLGLPWPGWFLVPPMIALFALLPALLTALALLAALALFGTRRLRMAVAALNGLMALAVCSTIVLESGHMPMKLHLLSESGSAWQPALVSTSPLARLAPSAWFADALLLGMQGDLSGAGWALGKLTGSVALLFAAGLGLGARLLSAANVAEESAGGRRIGRGALAGAGKFWSRLLSPPVAALIRKDLSYLARDSVLLSQLSMPLILYLVPFLLLLQEPTAQLRVEMFPFAAAMVGVILFMQTSILSLSSIGLEGRSFWIARAAPVGGGTVARAKFLMSLLVTGGIGVALSLLTGMAFRASLPAVALLVTLVGFCSAALCGLGVGIAAALPRFVYDNPAHRVSAWALILGFFLTVGYLVVAALLIGLTWLLAEQLTDPSWRLLVYAAGAAGYLLLTAIATLLPMQIGARRLERYSWEH